MTNPNLKFQIDEGAECVHFVVTHDIMLQPVTFDIGFDYLKGIVGQVLIMEARRSLQAKGQITPKLVQA